MLALPIALGTTDPPVIALMCLALACASRSANTRLTPGRPARTGPRPWGAASRWVTWNGLAALAIGAACAMKATASAGPPRHRRHDRTPEGPRAAVRFAGTAAAAAAILTIAFPPGAHGPAGRVR